ncbi:NADH-quinone oxidoreductase subunit C [bacterium]|nr:NADH-quinone oxidoreductase subunit C [bacterium]
MAEITDKKLKENFGSEIIKTEFFRGDFSVSVKPAKLLEIMDFLKNEDELKFDFLADVTAIDYLEFSVPQPERFAVVYQLYSHKFKHSLTLKAFLPENDLHLDSVYSLWKTANWLEREVYEMFGIHFRHHPELKKLLLPEDFKGFPERKDFPLKGIGYRENFPVYTRPFENNYLRKTDQ